MVLYGAPVYFYIFISIRFNSETHAKPSAVGQEYPKLIRLSGKRKGSRTECSIGGEKLSLITCSLRLQHRGHPLCCTQLTSLKHLLSRDFCSYRCCSINIPLRGRIRINGKARKMDNFLTLLIHWIDRAFILCRTISFFRHVNLTLSMAIRSSVLLLSHTCYISMIYEGRISGRGISFIRRRCSWKLCVIYRLNPST